MFCIICRELFKSTLKMAIKNELPPKGNADLTQHHRNDFLHFKQGNRIRLR